MMNCSKEYKFSTIFRFLLIFILTLLMQNTHAEENNNPQVKIVDYQPNQIVTLMGTHFIATSLQFAKNEKITGVYIGDQVAWTYALDPNTPYLLFLKPTLDSSNTNMTVLTRQHIYHFHLLSNKNTETSNAAIYNLQFRYHVEKKEKQHAKEKCSKAQKFKHNVSTSAFYHRNYILRGSASIYPIHVYDDSKFTYFEFPNDSEFPAIFVLKNANELLTNTQVQGNTLIAKCTAKTFLLVKNNEKAWVENKN